MLRQVFESDPIPYMKVSEYKGGQPLNGSPEIPLPYVEALFWISGMIVMHPPLVPVSRIFVVTAMKTKYHSLTGGASVDFAFDALTGKAVKRFDDGAVSLGDIFAMNGMHVSRNGTIYSKHYYQTSLLKIGLTDGATAAIGDDAFTKPTTSVWYVIQADAVQPNQPTAGAYKVDPNGTPTSPLYGFGNWAIDDVQKPGVLMDASGFDFRVFEFPSGKFKYAMTMPSTIAAICLADASRCYLLLNTNSVVLFDYVRGEVLGIAKVAPPADTGPYNGYWNAPYTHMEWDPVYKRLLILVMEADNPDGSCASRVRGYSMINEPTRITKPIPLKVPREGRVIPVLAQVVDELNHGVGGYVVDAKVY